MIIFPLYIICTGQVYVWLMWPVDRGIYQAVLSLASAKRYLQAI